MPWDIVQLNDKDLTSSTTSGQENNAFQLCFWPLFCSRPERHLPHSVVDSFKAKPVKYFNGI